MTGTRVHRDRIRKTAERYGIETSYTDISGQQRHASIETTIAALRALGANVDAVEDIPAAYEARREQQWRALCDPVVVAWNGNGHFALRAPSKLAKQPVTLALTLEGGEQRQTTTELRGVKMTGASRFSDGTTVSWSVPIPWELPLGYHRLDVAIGDLSGSSTIISAPEVAFAGPRPRTWGAFLPLYAMRTDDNWGAGNFTDLQQLYEWVRGLGGDLTGTLPMLPAFLDEPFEPSPYSPVSRLHWNEFFIDVTRVPEFDLSAEARDLAGSPDFQAALARLRADDLVDYREGMALRRSVLEILARAIDEHGGERRAEFEQWLAGNPRVSDYARYRAAVERTGTTFHDWPDRMKGGTLEAGDFDPDTARYHSYVQWIADEQLARLADSARRGGAGLYLDLPVGVNGGGYDVWRDRAAFISGFSVGAPPDPLNEQGQDWGFPPLHPERLSQTAYQHFIDVIRHHLRYAGTLRIDHVMGLHRQFWVPSGGDASDGLYVRYPAEHLYAILTLESHRHQTVIIGEDLGTVPDYVRPMMDRHGLNRMIVLPFALTREDKLLVDLPERAMLALDTHDMPPGATILVEWLEPEQREGLVKLLCRQGRLEAPTDDIEALVLAATELLAASDSRMVMINLEDLWFETRPQNVPGTSGEFPNWRRKAAVTFEEFRASPQVVDTLRRINELRAAATNRTNDNSREDTPDQP